MRHLMRVWLDFFEKINVFQPLDDERTRSEPIDPFKGSQKISVISAKQIQVDFGKRNSAFTVNDRRHNRQGRVPLSNIPIIEIMRRRDLDGTRPLLRIAVFIRDDRNHPVNERKLCISANQTAITRIFRMHRNRDIAEHGLGPRRRNRDGPSLLAIDGIANVPEMAFDFPALHFEIGDRGLQFRIPIDQTVVAIDQLFAVKPDENAPHRGGKPLIEGKPLAPPIERGAEAAQLLRDLATGLGFPLPDALQKFFAPEFLARGALGREQALDHHLRRNPGVIGPRLPQRIKPLHALPADQHVLQGEGERMTHMQAARDVGRRNHDGERTLVALRRGGERAGRLPEVIEPRFHRAR